MRIDSFLSEKSNGNRIRVSARVNWEDSDRLPMTVYFETVQDFHHNISANPHAFLISCAIPAMRYGEKRIFMDAEICPELKEGILTAMHWIRHWWGPDRPLPEIEAKVGSGLMMPQTPRRTACFFSGGIDSLATIRANRLNFPLEHPGSIKDALILYGQNIESDNRPESFQESFNALSKVAQDAEITLIPVYTNVRYLDESPEFFVRQFHGAILGAASHVFAQRLTCVLISASDDIPGLSLLNERNLKPLGSHPLLDTNYSSSDLRIKHEGLRFSRLDKTELVAGWDVGLQNIRVCQPNWPGENCGKCEKCVRTMLALLALGVLDQTEAFSKNDVSADMVSRIHISKPSLPNSYAYEQNYIELIPLLKEKGRDDLVRSIEQLIERYRNSINPKVSLKTKIWQFDQKYLRGRLTKLKQYMFS